MGELLFITECFVWAAPNCFVRRMVDEAIARFLERCSSPSTTRSILHSASSNCKLFSPRTCRWAESMFENRMF